MHVVNTLRTSNGPKMFCIDLEADWLLILDEVGGKSPGHHLKMYDVLPLEVTALLFFILFIINYFHDNDLKQGAVPTVKPII